MATNHMTFVIEGRDRLSRVLDNAGDAAARAEKKLALFGAAIPAAAALAPLAAKAGAAAVAVAAFGAAIVPQVSALSDASKAQTKYEDAVRKTGATSEEAVTAQLEFQSQVAQMPAATRRAAAALSTLQTQYKDWSNALAKDTMPVFTKGLAVASAMLPKMTPLVKGASVELDRFMTLIGGGISTPGFDAVTQKFNAFATTSLRQANDALVHFVRTFDTGKFGGDFAEFMDYARQQGPLLAATLKNVATAAVHLLQAASGVGVGLLQIANAAAAVVSSLPPGFITVLMQTAIAIRAVKLAGAGIQLLAGGFSMVATQITAMTTAAAGASGPMARTSAAVGTLSAKAKFNLAAVGVSLLAVALINLSKVGKQAPPDVDKLTTSLGNLARTGQSSGEAARLFGSDLDGLYDSVRSFTDPSTTDKVQQGLVKIFSLGQWDSTPVAEAKERFDAIDQGLTNLVKGGKADLAATALKRLKAEYAADGHDVDDFNGRLDKYKSALADAAFEADLAAESQGLFGKAAQDAQAALAEQKASADGLRQSLQALNDVQRTALGGMIGFEGAIDAAAKAAKDNAGALSMSHGQLNLNSEKARDAASALNDLAAKTEEAAADARQNGASWATTVGIYDRGRAKLVEFAQQMGLSKKEAKQLADQILQVPNVKTRVEMSTEDAAASLNAFNAAVKRSPGTKEVKLKTLSETAEAVLKSFGYKVEHLKDGSVKITAANGQALGAIRNVQSAVDGLHGKTISVITRYSTIGGGDSNHNKIPDSVEYRARGGPAPKFAAGGMPGGLLRGPGTGTSDSIPMWWASTGEYIVNARSTAKYRSLIEAINADTLGTGHGMRGAGSAAAAGLASGMTGATTVVDAAARAMAAAVTAGVRAELEIASPSKKMQALAKDIGAGLVKGLTGSRDKIKEAAADLAADIKAAFSGGKESSLLKMVDQQTKKLLDAAAKRDKVAAQIAAAKTFASDVTKNAREGAALGALGMDAEQVTAGGIKAGLAQKLAQMKTFTNYIGILARQGLSRDLLRQILNMGPEAGYAYASALVGADKATFNSINSLQKQLNTSSTALGNLGADALYDSGKQAGKGFLAGLAAQQKDIEKLMVDIAKGMQAAIKKALGIKSPSTVMARLGAYSTQGLALGLTSALPHVDRAMNAMTGRMTGLVTGARPVLGRAAVAGAGGTVINVQVDVHDAMDPVAVGREFQRVLLQFGRIQGTTVSLNVGG